MVSTRAQKQKKSDKPGAELAELRLEPPVSPQLPLAPLFNPTEPQPKNSSEELELEEENEDSEGEEPQEGSEKSTDANDSSEYLETSIGVANSVAKVGEEGEERESSLEYVEKSERREMLSEGVLTPIVQKESAARMAIRRWLETNDCVLIPAKGNKKAETYVLERGEAGFVGSGGFGEIWRVKQKGVESKKLLVIKVQYSPQGETGVIQEVINQKKMQRLSKFTVQSVASTYLEKESISVLILEHAGMTLKDYMKEKGSTLDELATVKIVQQFVKAVKAIHKEELSHNDLKPDNILIQPNSQLVKVGDFGCARTISYKTGSLFGSFPWSSPTFALSLLCSDGEHIPVNKTMVQFNANWEYLETGNKSDKWACYLITRWLFTGKVGIITDHSDHDTVDSWLAEIDQDIAALGDPSLPSSNKASSYDFEVSPTLKVPGGVKIGLKILGDPKRGSEQRSPRPAEAGGLTYLLKSVGMDRYRWVINGEEHCSLKTPEEVTEILESASFGTEKRSGSTMGEGEVKKTVQAGVTFTRIFRRIRVDDGESPKTADIIVSYQVAGNKNSKQPNLQFPTAADSAYFACGIKGCSLMRRQLPNFERGAKSGSLYAEWEEMKRHVVIDHNFYKGVWLMGKDSEAVVQAFRGA